MLPLCLLRWGLPSSLLSSPPSLLLRRREQRWEQEFPPSLPPLWAPLPQPWVPQMRPREQQKQPRGLPQRPEQPLEQLEQLEQRGQLPRPSPPRQQRPEQPPPSSPPQPQPAPVPGPQQQPAQLEQRRVPLQRLSSPPVQPARMARTGQQFRARVQAKAAPAPLQRGTGCPLEPEQRREFLRRRRERRVSEGLRVRLEESVSHQAYSSGRKN
ncbi:hypothetical protein EX30DRAFT_164791 [Ascodesmis nigricans]|uniref:Uncharacterized protein n=1 Tax=Ascodesmis nigricans TaxID=341454 RepID=A0A4S2MM99_9PEZI|nr:hypothetical protein EX30DRAFT_164791 [Ascodesmis nigricans]